MCRTRKFCTGYTPHVIEPDYLRFHAMNEYYHVIIENVDNNKEVLFRDLSKKDLKKKFIKPFNQGKDIIVRGTVHRIGNIRRVQIINTENTHSDELNTYGEDQDRHRDELNNRSSSVVFIGPFFGSDVDIVHCGNDVTEEFIKYPPSTRPGSLYNFFHNPWTVRVGGGIILVLLTYLITKYFGLAL